MESSASLGNIIVGIGLVGWFVELGLAKEAELCLFLY